MEGVKAFYNCSLIRPDFSPTVPSSSPLVANKDSSVTPLFTAEDISASSSIVLSPDSRYIFYTDGSLVNLGTSEVSMDSLTNTAHTSDDAVLISRLDLAAIHDFILGYDDIDLFKQYHQMLYMRDLLALSRFRFLSLLMDSSQYLAYFNVPT
ncbi:unnamed protein product [Rhizophagus irregularis]|nr:unnamed protein product [Rhizophagus irregularis]